MLCEYTVNLNQEAFSYHCQYIAHVKITNVSKHICVCGCVLQT